MQLAILRRVAMLLSGISCLFPSAALTQSIIPANDGTGTIVTQDGAGYSIHGGQLSSDGRNLFQSFEAFGLNGGEIANFLSNPSIENILGRVTGGNASVINGLIQVTGGSSNMFLLNPAGIVFGSTASLNVPASFMATTANGLSFGQQWFSSVGSNDYAALIGDPDAAAFTSSQSGAIVNAANLAVGSAQTLTLLGGTVISPGQLSAPDGQVVVSSAPGSTLVRLTPAGSLLSLEFQPLPASALPLGTSAIVQLPQLLTGGNLGNATGVTVNPDGSLQLTGSQLSIQSGDVVATTVTAGTLTLAAANNLIIAPINSTAALVQASGDLNLQAGNTLQMRDQATAPLLIQAGGNLTLQGDRGIDLLALNHPGTTPIQSSGNLTLISDGIISTDAHFSAGGDFAIQTRSGTLADVMSLYDPIITVGGNVNLGNYVGASLQVTAGGNIRFGDVVITAIDPQVDPDLPALVLSAGGTITGGGLSTTIPPGRVRFRFEAGGPVNTPIATSTVEVSGGVGRLGISGTLVSLNTTFNAFDASAIAPSCTVTRCQELLALEQPPANQASRPIATLEDAQRGLRKIYAETGVKPALIYVQFLPQPSATGVNFVRLEETFTLTFDEYLQLPDVAVNPVIATEPSEQDQLEVLVVTMDGEPIRKRVPGATRSRVLATAQQLSEAVIDPSDRSYLAPAQQLYRWLVAPVKTDLERQEIQNLVFILDAGLRTLPLAALHDGRQFVISHYSVGLMPSLSLTDTRRGDIKQTQVLAMGASEFAALPRLPAVPLELSLITPSLWPGRSFINQAFTLNTLQSQRQRYPYGVVHLATHASFEPGEPGNSYIQLWDGKLYLPQLRKLHWSNPPVELLVLSACQTAVGDEESELGFAGLAVQAGVKSAVASLWSVSDVGTALLMSEFYRQLKTAPTKAEALRRAQLAILSGEVNLMDERQRIEDISKVSPEKISPNQLSHPFYWSAFTLIGNPW